MRRVALRVGAAFALGLGLVALPAIADDPKTVPSDPPAKAPSFAGYVYVADVVGEVVRAGDNGVTLRVTWFEAVQKGGNKNNFRRPNLHANHRNFRNPYAANMGRPNQPQVTWKEHHHDYDLPYLPQSLVRTKTLPPKIDENGKKVQYTQKEYEQMRAPGGVTGYVASPGDIKPGTILEVILIRDKTIVPDKLNDNDLKIKYAIIQGQDPNPPKDITNPTPKNDKKSK